MIDCMKKKMKDNHRTKTINRTTMNRMTVTTTLVVSAIQLILKQAIAFVMPEARIAMANVAQTDTTGGSILSERLFSTVKGYIISFGEDNSPKNT